MLRVAPQNRLQSFALESGSNHLSTIGCSIGGVNHGLHGISNCHLIYFNHLLRVMCVSVTILFTGLRQLSHLVRVLVGPYIPLSAPIVAYILVQPDHCQYRAILEWSFLRPAPPYWRFPTKCHMRLTFFHVFPRVGTSFRLKGLFTSIWCKSSQYIKKMPG